MGNKLLGVGFSLAEDCQECIKQNQSSICERDEVSGQGGFVFYRIYAAHVSIVCGGQEP